MQTVLTRFKPIWTGILCFFCVAIALYICFAHLGKAPFENWDEAWYADITRTMLRTREFTVPVWNQSILLDKPPFFMWIAGLFSLPFGISEVSVRLPSALSGFLIIMIVGVYVFRKWGTVAAVMSFFTLTLNNVFIWRVRTGNLDALVTLFILLCYIVSFWKDKRKYPLLGLLFSAIYLTKASLVAFPLLFITGVELVYNRNKLKETVPHYLLMLFVFLLGTGVWLFSGYLKMGTDFPMYYLFHSDQKVTQVSLTHFKADYLLFAYYALQRRFAFLFVAGLIFLLLSIKKRESVLLFGFASGLIILLSFTQRSNNWYLVPSMPFWSIIIGFATHRLISVTKKLVGAKIALVCIVGGLVISTYLWTKTFTVNIRAILSSVGTQYQADAGRWIALNSPANAVVIRTDVLYPTAVYYSDRKVYSYQPHGIANSTFINFVQLSDIAPKKNIVLSGKKQDVVNFLNKEGAKLWKDECVRVFENPEEHVYLCR